MKYRIDVGDKVLTDSMTELWDNLFAGRLEKEIEIFLDNNNTNFHIGEMCRMNRMLIDQIKSKMISKPFRG